METQTININTLAKRLGVAPAVLLDRMTSYAAEALCSEALRQANIEWFDADKADRPKFPPNEFEERHLIEAAQSLFA